MALNRNLAYIIRKYMPDIPFVNNRLAEKRINGFRKLFIPESSVKEGEKNPSRIPEIVARFEKERVVWIKSLTESFDIYLKAAGIRFSSDEYVKRRISMLFHCLAYGFAPDEYIYYRLDERTLEEKRAYVADLERKIMQYLMSNFRDLQYVFDKAATYEKFGKFFKRDEISVSSRKDFGKFEAFAKKHDYLVIKQVSSSCGRGISLEKSDRGNLGKQFESILARGRCSIEERIVQADIMARFNTSSVNTLRVIMFRTKHGIKIGPCFFRTGHAGSFVDNAGSGGVFTGVDRHTGILDSHGVDEYLHSFEMHPDSGIRYKGFQLPCWGECIALVEEMASLVPKLGYVGWDLAYTDKGWVLVEANGGSQFVSQICYDKGCKEEVMQYVEDRITTLRI